MRKLISLVTLLSLVVLNAYGQRTFDIRLVQNSISCETNEFCYDVQIRSGDDMLWRFAGQNYRLFYNGALAEYSRVERVLESPYAEPEVVQDIQHIDLSAEGNLPFDSDLSWLNFFIDMNVAEEARILTPDVWTTTTTVCFTSLVDLMSEGDFCFEMVWAREDLTFNYATAFVEVSEWLAVNSTNDHVLGSNYFDFDPEDDEGACFDLVCGDTPPSYDTKIVLKSSDPQTNINCYAIQLKSANSRVWQLGDQQHSVLYDGSQASFVSAQSSQSGSGTLAIGETLENESYPNGSGSVSFEDNLSALSFTIDGGLTIGESYTDVAEICLDMTNQSNGDCFEIVLGREGLTDEYFAEETEILYSEEIEAVANSYQDYDRCVETECPDLTPPVSNGDITICQGDDIPLLSVQAAQGMIIRWYATPVGGTALSQGETYGPSGAGIFYAEYYSEDENCTSSARTAVALIVMPLPEVEVLSKECTVNGSTYTMTITTDADEVETDKGTVKKLIGLDWMISGVPEGETVELTLSNDVTGCERVEIVESPNCECEAVTAPSSNGDLVICLSEPIPSLSVDSNEESVTTDWYLTIEGGTSVAAGESSYTPSNITQTGTYTYYAQSRSLESGCESATRTAVSLTVQQPPVYAFVDTEYDNFDSYTVIFYTDSDAVSSDVGIVSAGDNGVYRVTEIPPDTEVTVSITSPEGCMISRTISSPEWECEKIIAPVCEGEFVICEGMDYPGFKAFAYPGKGIRWYDQPTEGTLLAEGNLFKPTIGGTYYAEAYDSISACVSVDRAEVQLIINPMPEIQLSNDVFCEGEVLVWADFAQDVSGADGSISVFTDFRDAMNNENAISEPSIIISEIEAYFIRKTSSSGCFDIETVIVVPEECDQQCLAGAGNYGIVQVPCIGLEAATIRWAEITPPRIPTDYVEAFVITRGDGNEILDIVSNSEYMVSQPGQYRVHSFVYRPSDSFINDALDTDGLTLEGLAALLIPNGGSICGALDEDGLLFDMSLCPNMCRAEAGQLEPLDIECLEDEVELEYEVVPLSVTVPQGFVQTFVLTNGPNMIILAIGDGPFIVNSAAEFRVHSLVIDPNTFDMTTIQPGINTGFDLAGQLMSGGGDICGSFDMDGAYFNVIECGDEECEAEAESIIAIADLCIDDSPINVTPGRVGGEVPVGYVSTLVLTTGEDLIIQDIQTESFTISNPLNFRVHSLVYDPGTLDLSSVQMGATPAEAVLGLLIQGEGMACGALDITGTSFSVGECIEICEASSGRTIPQEISCLDEGEEVALSVDISGAVVPAGYVQSTIITNTEDLTIVSIQSGPYLATKPGEYEVSSFVYDPSTFDVGIVSYGETEFFDIYNQFQEGDGDICGSIELTGSRFDVEMCEEGMIDISIDKQISNSSPVVGEEITFTITVSNSSNTDASGLSVVDYLPQGYDLTGNISHGGMVSGSDIVWDDLEIDANDFVILSFMARVVETDNFTNYENVAELVTADQEDLDSTPNNDDGDQSEDDEDSIIPNVTNALIDLELIKTANTISIVKGETITYNINVSNRAMTIATGVEVTDVLPDGIDLSSVTDISNGGQLVGNVIVWDDLELGFFSSMNLSFSAEVEDDFNDIMLTNTVEVTDADQDDIDSTPDNEDGDQSEDDESSTTIQVVSPYIDLSISKSASNITPEVGELVTFSISVRNDGIITATGISVADMLPMSGYDIGSIQGMNPAGQIVGNTLIWTIDELDRGESATLSFSVSVLEGGADYKNIAQITTADQQDIDSTPNNDDGDQSEDDEDSVTIVPMLSDDLVDIEVNKAVNNINPSIGSTVEYIVTVSNNGPSTATNLVVRDVTPDGIDAVDVTGNADVTDGVITWTIPSLGVGQNVTFTYNSIVFESDSDDYCNIVQLMSVDQQDIDSAPGNDDGDQSEDDEDKVTLFPAVRDNIDLELEKGAIAPCTVEGQRVDYFISVFNNSDVVATGVSVEDILPDGLTDAREVSSGGSVVGNRVVWNDLTLLPGEDFTLAYSAEVVDGAMSYVNTAQIVAADQVDIDSAPDNDNGDQSEDDEASYEIGIGIGVDLELEKLVDNPRARPGERVQFSIRVSNTGCMDATGVAVRDIIPGGYKQIRNISGGGIRTANIILWEDLFVAAGSTETLTFTAEIVHFSINCDYINIAEIYAADQEDVDSTPGNDDGDQSEDDEDSAEVAAGGMADMTLRMASSMSQVVSGDIVTYTLSLCNEGPGNAFNVQVRDYLPEGVEVVGDINYKGQLSGDEITWSGFTVVTGECADLSFQARVMDANSTNEIVNEAEIILSDQLDPDSSPGNGMLGEDDDTHMSITQFVGQSASVADLATEQVADMVEVDIETALFLEGAYNKKTGLLNTTLNSLGYLPGQKPKSFFAEATPAGQPFAQAPWYYEGNEGQIYDFNADFYIEYPADVVDWVLVSVREDINPESTVITRAALLKNDGQIIFPEDAEPVYLDANKPYYLLVQHRNHLPVLSSRAIDVEQGQLSFDFRTNESYIGLLGSGQKDVDGTYCVFAANGEQLDSKLSEYDINVRDMNVWFQSNGQNSSYLIADFDMNGDVNVKDQLIWLLNNGVFSDIPR